MITTARRAVGKGPERWAPNAADLKLAEATLTKMATTPGYHTTPELADLMKVPMPTMWRALYTLRGQNRMVRRKRNGRPPWEYALRHHKEAEDGR